MTFRRLIDLVAALGTAALIATALSSAPGTETIAGNPRVVDGDTLHFEPLGERVRLVGIDAPESRQWCTDGDGDRYRCGAAAARALETRIAGRPVRCEGDRRGSYGRRLAVCYSADGVDLNGWLVSQGHALAYRRYSTRYVTEEQEARKKRRGIWQGEFVTPWRWRRGDRLR